MRKYKILTPQEVADIMKVSLKTVYRWIAAGNIQASQVGDKTYRVFEKDLLLYMEKTRVVASDKRLEVRA